VKSKTTEIMQHAHDMRVDDILRDLHAPCSLTAGDSRSDSVDSPYMQFDESHSGFLSSVTSLNDYESTTHPEHGVPVDTTLPCDDAPAPRERTIDTVTNNSVHTRGFTELLSDFEAQFLAVSHQEQLENAFIATRLAMVAYTV
jgi:hypothetical protein